MGALCGLSLQVEGVVSTPRCSVWSWGPGHPCFRGSRGCWRATCCRSPRPLAVAHARPCLPPAGLGTSGREAASGESWEPCWRTLRLRQLWSGALLLGLGGPDGSQMCLHMWRVRPPRLPAWRGAMRLSAVGRLGCSSQGWDCHSPLLVKGAGL